MNSRWISGENKYLGGVKFLLISFVVETSWQENQKQGYVMRMGIAYLASHLLNAGHQISTYYCPYTDNQEILLKNLAREIEEVAPDVIGFSITSDNFWMLQVSVKQIKDKYNLPILVGGPHAIIDPQSVIELEGVSGVCIGEGETPIVKLANALSDGKLVPAIEGLYFKGQKAMPSRGILHDIDTLCYPERESYLKRYSGMFRNGWVFQSHRGCPHRCAFCSEDFFKKIFKGKKYVRSRGINNLIEEIRNTIKKYPTKLSKFVGFSNPTLNISQKWLLEFCHKYSENVGFPFGCDIELSNLTEEAAQALADARCREAWIGFESGNDFMRKKILKKNLSAKQAIQKIEMLKSRGIKVVLYVIIGLPFETEEMIQDTYTVLKEISADAILPSIFLPLPGTQLGEICFQKGWAQRINKDNAFPVQGYYKSILKYSHITPEKIQHYHGKIRALNQN